MTKNMGAVDRIVRLILATVVAYLIYANVINGIAAIVLGAIAVVFAVTSIVGICPAYSAINVSTKKKQA